MAPDPAAERARMVADQLAARGIADEHVLAAMAEVPRERFVPATQRRRAYDDAALGIGAGQTISQPWVVAAILEALVLTGEESALEIGTGSGYSAALLGRLAGTVISVERIAELVGPAREALAAVGATNVEVREGDGSAGIPDAPPFDAIAVHAAAPDIPRELLRQLAPGGRLVAPIAADRRGERLTAFRRVDRGEGDSGPEYEARPFAPVRFVPLIGDAGYSG
jgi:protein-L-isoaspartate(D-aspartate) O-methyltransferase